ncbi:indolepyruvate oxidoreductase subunit beta [bacterium]|nr:indolepyruvate oxidoreductase subunit beta [bacterium]
MNRNKTTNVLIVGVGGQGILLASEVVSQAALLAGLDVKKSEIHGMSQRGGTVNSHVRYGEKVLSPIIPQGQVDVLVALEKLEALRWSGYLAPDGAIVVNDFRLDPVSVATGKIPYTENAIDLLYSNGRRVLVVDGVARALQAGDLRSMNVVLLGALSRLLEFPAELWEKALEAQVKEKFIELNRRAFALGRDAADSLR